MTNEKGNNNKQTEVPYCKIVTCTNIMKTRGNDKSYQEAIEASSKFNKRLINERKMRIPFLDSQTTVAQANCMIWNMEYQRMKSNRIGYVYRYPVKTWFKNRRLAFENDSSNMLHRLHLPMDLAQQQQNLNENSNHSLIDPNNHHHHLLNHHHHHSSNIYSKQLSNEDHHHHHNHHHKPNGRLPSASANSNGPAVDHHHHHHDWHDSYENENNDDLDSDADDFEDPKRKRGKRGRGKKNQNKDSSTNNGDDKPFVCDRCGVKYKTKPGLAYHVQKAHNTPSTPTASSLSNAAHGSHAAAAANNNLATASKTHDLIDNENTNSVFDSVYDDMNSSSSLPQAASSSSATATSTTNASAPHQNTNFSASLLANNNIHSSKTAVNNKCGICTGTEQENRNGQHESFVSCCECTKSFHPLCLSFTPTMIKAVKKYKWQCIECKRCTVCGNSENDDKLLFCDDCDRGWHSYCLNPPLTAPPEGDWRCELCVKQT